MTSEVPLVVTPVIVNEVPEDQVPLSGLPSTEGVGRVLYNVNDPVLE